MSKRRIREILEQKAMMGAGVMLGGADYPSIPIYPRGKAFKEYDNDILMYGGKKKRAPSAFNKKVSKIMKEYGVPLGEASKMASKMSGGVVVGGRRRKKRSSKTMNLVDMF